MILKIESKQNPKIKELANLRKPSGRKAEKEFVIEGFHLLEMALKKGTVKRVFLTKENKQIPSLIPQYSFHKVLLFFFLLQDLRMTVYFYSFQFLQ